MSALDKIRQAFPDLKDASDSELLGEISKLTGTPYESAATMLGVAPRGTMAETARQIGAGFAVDLPKMVGQGLQYTGVAPETGRSLVESAKERAYGWTPDLRGRGLVGEALVTGGRAIGPMAPAIAASFVPGGQFAAPAVAAGLFGTSSAQETYEKLIGQGVPEEDAIAAARRVGLVQGPLEGAATAVGLGAFRAAKPLVGLGGTTAGLAAKMTDTSVLKPFAKGMAANMVVQPTTEVVQDVSTAKIEEAYGGKPEDISAIARSSALGGIGLTMLLGPLAIGGHVARANRAEKLKEALYSPDTAPEIRAQALDLVMGEAKRQGVAADNVDQWFDQQLMLEDARNAELAKLEEEKALGERNLLVTEEAPIQQRIDEKLGLTRTTDRKGYEKQFEAAFTEGTGQRVADAETGIERELTAGELVQRDLPQDLTAPSATTTETKPAAKPIFSELDTTLNKQGIKPTKTTRDIYQYMVAENIDPESSEAEKVLNALAASKMGEARKAIAEIIRARSPRVSTPVSTVQQPAGSVGVVSPVVQGSVGDAGRPAPVAGTMVRSPTVARAPLQQAGVLPVATSQPSTPVTTGEASGTQAPQTVQAAPQGQATTTVPSAAPAVKGNKTLRLVKQEKVDDQEAALSDYVEIARETGNTAGIDAALADAANKRQDQRDFTKDDIDEIIELQVGKGKNKERDRQILRAYVIARKFAPYKDKGKVKAQVGKAFGVTASRVGQIGNPEKLADIAVSMGFDRNQVFTELGIQSTKEEAVNLKQDRESVVGEADTEGTVDAAEVVVDDTAEGDVEALADDARFWQKSSTAGSTLAVQLVQVADAIEAVKAAKAELEQLGVTEAAESIQARIEELTAKYEAITVAAAEKTAPKAAPVSKATATVKEAQQRWKDAGRDITKLSSEDLGLLLPYVRDTIKNTELAGKITAELANRGETNAVQVESPASVPVQPKAETGQGVVAKVRRAQKPAAESKAQVPAVILTQAEQAAQAWDVVAADYPQAPKFADLTKAQQNNFIGFGEENWTKADVETELTKMARTAAPSQPKLRALRTVTTTDADNASVELQEQELARLEKVPGVGNALSRFRKEGLGNLVDYVGGWYVTDSNVDWDGGFTAIDGQAAVLLRRGALTDSERVEWTVYHEVGHAADQTHLEDGGVFSSQPEFNVRLEKGKIKPVGSVMKEAFDFYTNNPTSDLAKHLSYPFNRAQHSDLDGDGIREELFAQLWATYTTRDGREFLEDNLPTVADFMEQAYEQVKQTDYVAAAANEAQNTAKAGGQATQGNGQSGQVPLRQTAVRFRAIRPQGLIDRNIAKLPQQSQQPVRRVTEAIGDLGGKYLDYAVFTNDLVKRAQALGLGAAKTFSDRLAARNAKVSEEERKIEKIADRYALIEDDNKGDGPGSVNEFLFESTRTGKWGYNTGNFKADPAMKAMFDKLGPKAQQFVKDVFAHGDATLSNKKKIVLDATNSEYDAMIKAAQDLANTATDSKVKADAEKELAKLKAEKAATLKRFQTLFRIREGIPYAPIKRTGAYVVIGESAAYKAAKANKDTATIKKLESDPDHYHVSFVDTKWQARNLSDKLAEQGVFDGPQIVKRSESFDEAFSGEAMLPALTKMRAAVDRRAQDANGKKDPTAGKLLNIINQLYLEALAEGSARKSEMRRRGVAGEVDMLQSFTQQGRADANFLASVEFEPKIQDALQQMRNQSRTGDRERKSEIFDELTQRYADSLDPKPSPFINGLTNMASKFFLASSPGYYLQNLTQPFMMSLPAMAGRHDYTKAAKELFNAYAELGPMFKDVKLFDQQFDFSKVGKTTGEKAAINDLVNQGKIDIGLATEINEYKVGADGNLSKFAQRLNKGMRMAVQKVEATNRLSTAIAAYRLEFARTNDAAKATQYAADILTETHGDYTAFNAPRAFNTQWGKVALQFRKFQLIQIAFYAKLFRDIGRTPEERAAALKTLGYSLGHTAVFAGMMGLPGYAAISAILGAFGDDDEKFDLTAEMRKALGPEWADMVMRGAPTVVGMDLSGKIGAGNMLSIMPFSDADLNTNAGRAEAFGTLMGGAALGMTSRVIDGLGLIASGDYYKGIERTMPKGVSDALKAGRQGAEGMTRRNGDVVLPDSEVSALDTVWTAMGLPAVKQAVTYERQNRMRDVTENFNDRTTRVKNDYAKAVREQDTQAMAEARAAWTKLQQTRQRNGLQPQPVSALLKAPQEQKAREKRTVEGVAYRQGQQKLAESIAAN